MAPMASSTDDRLDLDDVLVEKDAPKGVEVEDWNLRMKGWAFVWMGDGVTSEDGFVDGGAVGGDVEVDLKRRDMKEEWFPGLKEGQGRDRCLRLRRISDGLDIRV